MIKTIVTPIEGFESLHKELCVMKDALNDEKQADIDKVVAEVESKYAEKSERIDALLRSVTTTEEIEVPDEQESVCNSELIENTIVEPTL